MTEKFKVPKPETPSEESLETKKERLRPIIEWAIDQFCNTEKPLEEIAVEASRKLKDGTIETIPDLVILETDEDGVNLAGIENNEPTASATMLWSELIDLKKMIDKQKEGK